MLLPEVIKLSLTQQESLLTDGTMHPSCSELCISMCFSYFQNLVYNPLIEGLAANLKVLNATNTNTNDESVCLEAVS